MYISVYPSAALSYVKACGLLNILPLVHLLAQLRDSWDNRIQRSLSDWTLGSKIICSNRWDASAWLFYRFSFLDLPLYFFLGLSA